jgi:CheY-like chemotaxis protein
MKTILLVDDDEIFRETLAARVGHEIAEVEVRTAEHGRRALEIVSETDVDMIVTELNMPVMDGFELLATLREQGSRIPVMVVTEFLLDEVQEILSNLGYYMFHRKGANPQNLIDRIKDTAMPEVEGSLVGVSLAGFLQLLEAERKNCMIIVSDRSRKGTIFVHEGAVIHAETKFTRGLDAAMDIVCWNNVRMEILHNEGTPIHTITMKLQDLLLRAFVSHDEGMGM